MSLVLCDPKILYHILIIHHNLFIYVQLSLDDKTVSINEG